MSQRLSSPRLTSEKLASANCSILVAEVMKQTQNCSQSGPYEAAPAFVKVAD